MTEVIDPYHVADCLANMLENSSATNTSHTLPMQGLERRMGPGVFACAGAGVAITSVAPGTTRPNCEPDPLYTIEVTIARDCAVEFNDDGATINPVLEAMARQISLDSAVLWSAYTGFSPRISWQITGGLALTTAAFQINGEFGLVCA